MPQQCVFCQLVNNPEQTLTVHETEDFRAWLDINPRARGHTMVVPKEHMESAAEIDGKLGEMFDVARIAGEKAMNGLGADGYSIVVNNGEAAGQNLDHFYMIVFPRYEDEENAGTPTGAIFRPMEDMDQNDLREIHESMQDAGFSDYSETKETRYDKIQRNGDDEEGESEERSSKGFRRKDGAEFR